MINQRIEAEANDHQFADNIFKLIFLFENYCILTWKWEKFVPKGPMNNM